MATLRRPLPVAPQPVPLGYTAPPTPTFTPPNPQDVANDPYYQFRSQQGEQAIQRSAAARGTLLNGGTLKALEGYRQGLASEEAGKAFDRSLQTFGANTNAGLGYGRLGLDTATTNANMLYRGAQDQQAYQQDLNDYNQQPPGDPYADYVMAQRGGGLNGGGAGTGLQLAQPGQATPRILAKRNPYGTLRYAAGGR